MSEIVLKQNTSSFLDVEKHLLKCNHSFVPKLDSYVDISSYALKIYENALKYEVWARNKLKGLLAVYFNEEKKIAFITNLSIEEEYRGGTVGTELLFYALRDLEKKRAVQVKLHVFNQNERAIKFYLRSGFVVIEANTNQSTLCLNY